MANGYYEDNGIENEAELNKMVKNQMMTIEMSQSSFKLSDVTNFVFGPFVSRFWMLRKHNMMMRK